MKVRPARAARWIVALGAALSAASIVACGGGGSGSGSGDGSGKSAGSAAGSAVVKAPVKHSPRHGDGSAAALSKDGKQVFVAGEDHEVVFVAPASFADLSAVRVVPMPGPPAQVVVADDLVLVTVRTLPTDDAKAARAEIRGPLPEASAARRLAAGKLPQGARDFYRDYHPPFEYRKYLEDKELDPPPPPPASAAASAGKPAESASARSKSPPPPPQAKGGTPAKPFDPAVVRKSQGGLLLILKPDAERGLVEVGRVTLPPDAWGLGVTPDGLRAIVTSAWPAVVSVVDINEKKVIASLPVAREPRGLAISGDGKTAYVSHLVGTDLTRIDNLDGAPKVSVQPLPAGRSRASEKVTPAASLGWSLVLSPDGESLFVPRHAIGAAGANAWWGAPVVDVLDRKSGQPLAPLRRPGSPVNSLGKGELAESAEWWGGPGKIPTINDDLVQPRAVVYRKKADTLLIAGEGRSAVVELNALAPDPALFRGRTLSLPVFDSWGEYAVRGGGPSALVLSEDEDSLYVFCRTTYDLVKINLETERAEWLRLAEDTLPEDAKRGRRLYADARSDALSGGLGCESCHPEGRDDGYVWREVILDAADDEKDEKDAVFVGLRQNMKRVKPRTDGDPDPKQKYYPRQTPMLAGRVRSKGPYGWHAEAPDMTSRLERAFRLHRPSWFSYWGGDEGYKGPRRSKVEYLADYMQSGLLPPPTLDLPLTDAEKRGKAIFESAESQCTKCHVPATELTDRLPYPLRDLPVLPGFDAEKKTGFKTPSLFFVARTAPYFHDGSQATLADLVKNNGSRMGQTAHLGPDEQAALVAYLETL